MSKQSCLEYLQVAGVKMMIFEVYADIQGKHVKMMKIDENRCDLIMGCLQYIRLVIEKVMKIHEKVMEIDEKHE